jgi:hypothetical protein
LFGEQFVGARDANKSGDEGKCFNFPLPQGSFPFITGSLN